MKYAVLVALLMATPVASQTPEMALGLARGYLVEGGVLTSIDQTRVEEGVVVTEGFRMFGAENSNAWSLTFERVRIGQTPEGIRFAPEGAIAVEMRWGQQTVQFGIDQEGLALDALVRGNEAYGFEIAADSLVLTPVGDALGMQGSVTVSNIVLREEETTGAQLLQTLSWGNIALDARYASTQTANGFEIMGELGSLTLEVESFQRGLLEGHDWLGALEAGMQVEARATLGRSGFAVMMDGQEGFDKGMQRLDLGRLEMTSTQGPASVQGDVRVQDVVVGLTQATGASSGMRLDAGTLSAQTSLFQSGVALPHRVEMTTEGSVSVEEETWPLSFALGLTAQARPVIDLYDYSIVTETGTWRAVEDALDVREITGSMQVGLGEETMDVTSQLTRLAPEGTIGVDMIEGATRGEISSTQPFLDFIGQSGVISQAGNQVLLAVFQELFGADAGVSGGTVSVDILVDGGIRVNDMQLR